MDRKDALEFLELPEFATPEEIKVRLEDRLAYFENLSEKAPSEFVRRLHGRNVAKVREIMQVAGSWPAAAPPVEAEEPGAEEEVEEAIEESGAVQSVEEHRETESGHETVGQIADPVGPVEAPAERADLVPGTDDIEEPLPPVTYPEPPVADPEVPVLPVADPEVPEPPVADHDVPVLPVADPNEPLGWLIRHTENQSPVAFPLMAGANFVGRKGKPDLTSFITVAEDPYISKVHAVVFAGPDGFFLADNASANGGKASTNGTYLNAQDDRVSTKTRLKNRDTIQIGITKLILRYNDKQLSSLVDEVAGQDYMHTVVINI